MRQAIGGFVRRADWTQAARGAKALAESLLLRGRTLDARAAIDDARSYGEKGGHDGTLVDLALLAGHAWIDLIRLDEAEGVLSAAMDAAATRADRAQVAEASLAMARCLFWRGRYADADAVLASCSAGSTDRTAVRVAIAASRQAVGRRDLGRAVAAAAEAIARAAAAGAPDLQADAACAAAFAHLAVSDLEAVERDVAAGVTHARAARRPVCAIRARVLLVEAERRRGRPSVAAALLHRLTRIAPSSLPPIVWARCSLLADTLKPDASIAAIVARHTRGSGLMGLALLLPDVSARAQPADFDGFVDGLVGILHACQNADEETAVLVDVCGRLRQQLHAAAVAVVRVHGPHVDIIAHDGARLDPAVAHRAIDAGITIAPHRAEDRIEAAAPIRYGGATIAAMAARWPIATTQPLAGAPTVLTMAAAAVAPAVAAAIARASAPARPGPAELLGVSAAMADVRRSVERAAAAPFCVLIEGESGCGKELVARAVHRCSPRRDRAFCTLNCAALPDDLVESELFGHAKGAFTGAVGERPGVFEEAHGGTLFLDEIGELSLRAQAKVLRVIQEGELRRVGENLARRVDVRILSATNRDLRQDVAAGRFRLDLLYRLDVLRIAIPPLRDRREDIAGLVEHFWSDAARRVGSRATLSSATVAVLARYGWPGNVRELQNVLAALAVRTPKRGVVSPAALAPPFGHHEAAESWRLDEARRTFETRFVRAALVRTGGHRARAAIELGVSRQGLAKLMLRLGISESPSAQS
jgi:DNA-binding NtrC family response regulator